MSYYDRVGAVNSDGTPLFGNAGDEQAEREARALIEGAWRVELRKFAPLSPVDFYAVRDGRVAGVVEFKRRSHSSDAYPTVFLNVRKWLALMMAANGLGVGAAFVVAFTDGTRWIDLKDVDARRVRMGGCSRVVKSQSDIEPVIEVPVSEMRALGAPPPLE